MTKESIAENKLNRSRIYIELKAKAAIQGDALHSATIALVNNAAEYCHNKLKTVIRHMPEFTLHDETHIFNVVYLMEKLIPESTMKRLSVPELMLLLLCALFHDIGMAPDEAQVRAWKKDWANGGSESEQAEYRKFIRFCSSYPDRTREIENLREADQPQQAQLIEEYLISEYIRETHADRTRHAIASDWAGKIKYGNTDLTSELADLCLSHNEDAIKLLDMTTVLCDQEQYVCLPFVGVILRLSDVLDFDPKRTPSVLFSHLSIRDPVSLMEWKKHRAINAWQITSTSIIYSARCAHPAIEASIRRFCDLIDMELRDCSHVLTHISDVLIDSNIEVYRIPLPASVDRSKIGPGHDISTGKPLYIYRDTQFTLSKNQVIDLLMGTKLYGNTEVALRELIQNSIDACLVRDEMERAWNNTDYSPQISVRYCTEKGDHFLEVEDNGIGMNQHIIDEYYAKVGSSFYRSREFHELLAEIGRRYKPISRFGIGILSCFMVSDSIDVQTRRLGSDTELDEPLNIVIRGYDSIFYIREGDKKRAGTVTRLRLRTENPWKRMSHQDFTKSVQRSVPNPPFCIEIETDKEVYKHDQAYFTGLRPEGLKKHDWEHEDNIREVEIELLDPDAGIQGKAIVGVLEQDQEPVESIEVLSKTVEIDDASYELSLGLDYDHNEIEKRTTSINVMDDGSIGESHGYSVVAKSRSAFSINGIDFPDGIFPDYLGRHRQAELRWPFPMLLVLDVSAPTDLDLNTSRTEIINNNKWHAFERQLAHLVCKAIFLAVEPDYAKKLVGMYAKYENEDFQEGLKKAVAELALTLRIETT